MEEEQDEVSEKSGMRGRIVGKSAPVNEHGGPAEAPQFQFTDKVAEFPFVARSQDVVDAGVTGETHRMGAWTEVVAKSCSAGTDSALETHIKSCDAGTDSPLEACMEDSVGVPMSEKVQECVEVVRLTPHERVRQRTVERGVDVPVSQILDEVVGVVTFLLEAPQVQQHIDEVPMVETVLKTVEAPRLQYIDTIGEIPVVAKKQIPTQDQFRMNSHEFHKMTSGSDEFLSLENLLRKQAGCLNFWR